MFSKFIKSLIKIFKIIEKIIFQWYGAKYCNALEICFCCNLLSPRDIVLTIDCSQIQYFF